MPHQSEEYKYLSERVTLLSNKFLEDQIEKEIEDPTSFTPDVERIAAFQFLVHAEFEEYIEKKASKWIKEKETIIELESFKIRDFLEIYQIASLLDIKINFSIPFEMVNFIDQAKSILKDAKKIIKENNGIKKDSFMKLSILSGKLIDEIDSDIANSLTEYGKGRGEIAHRSVSAITTIQAPSVEKYRASEIVKSLGTYFYNN